MAYIVISLTLALTNILVNNFYLPFGCLSAVSLDYNIKMKSLVLWLLMLGAQTLLAENYLKGLCMTAKRSHCGSGDRAVSVRTKDNLIMYCNECEACRMHDVRSC